MKVGAKNLARVVVVCLVLALVVCLQFSPLCFSEDDGHRKLPDPEGRCSTLFWVWIFYFLTTILHALDYYFLVL